MSFHKIKKAFKFANATAYLYGFIYFVIFTIIGFYINQLSSIQYKTSLLLYIWGFRNIARFFVYWICCIVNYNESDTKHIIHILFISFFINFIISAVQFLIFGVKGDFLGGIFGFTGASNSFTLNLLIIILCFSTTFYLQGSLKFKYYFLILMFDVSISALAELKLFILLFPVIILALLILHKKITNRVVNIIVWLLLAIFLLFLLLSLYFPQSIEFFSPEGIAEYLSKSKGFGYATANDLSRAHALSQIYDMFYKNDFLHFIMGFGLGACETSSFSFLQSGFYVNYDFLNYRWFFHAMTFLELGAVGIIFSYIYLGSILLKRNNLESNKYNQAIFNTTRMVAFYSIILTIYNSSLRIESGYLLFLIFSLPFILIKSNNSCLKEKIIL